MTIPTEAPRKGDRVRVSWKDGEIDRTAEFIADGYRPGHFLEHPEVSYKNALGRGFFVIGPGYSVEILERAKPKPYVPGTVLEDKSAGTRYTVLPDGRYFDHQSKAVYTYGGFAEDGSFYTVVLDPREAKALPNPVGIRVGDTVRREECPVGTCAKITTEFEVSHISGATGFISAKYGPAYNPNGFEVTSREVQDRLPAGTILRGVRGFRDQGLRLITERGGYYLGGKGLPTADRSNYVQLVKDGYFEVIYLP